MTSWKHCSIELLKAKATLQNPIIAQAIRDLFKKYKSLFYTKNITREEWAKHGWYKYGSNPDKLILTHKEFPEYIFKLISPLFLKPNDKESQSIIRMNLSRVFVAREIKKYSLKWVTVPQKFVLYIETIDQIIVIAQKLSDDDLRDTEKKLKALGQEHLDAVVKSFEGDKIYIIDTENASEVTEETEKELILNMKAQFNFFSNNFLNPSISPRYTRRYSTEGNELTSPSSLINPKSMIKHWERFAKQNNVSPIQSKKGYTWKEVKSEEEFKIKRIKSILNLKEMKESDFHLKEIEDEDPSDENPLIIVQSPKKEKNKK